MTDEFKKEKTKTETKLCENSFCCDELKESELFAGLCENCMREIEETEWDDRRYCGDE
jgi:hypothetical protein